MASEWHDHLAGDGSQIDQFISDLDAQNLAINQQLAEALDKIAEHEGTPETPPEPEPEPKPARTMLVGSSLYSVGGETLQEGYQRRTQEWGAGPEIVRHFFPGLPNGWPQYGTAQTVVSFKPPSGDMAGFASGKYDTNVVAWLNSLPRDTKVRRVALFHEREDDIESGRFTMKQACDADARFRSLIDEANSRNGTNVRLGLVLMGWTVDSRSGRPVDQYFGTTDYDWVGWDAYPGNSFAMDQDLSDTKTLYGKCAAKAKEHGADHWFICETGTSNKGHSLDEYDTMQAKWITGAVQAARDAGFRGWMYWDSVTGTGQANNYLVQGPKAKAAMGAAIKG